jgi:uncharacterized protein (TIGR02996 family)
MPKLLPHSPELQALLDAVRANVEDPAPRLALADWLDERDDPRGEMVRLAHAFDTEEFNSPQRDAAEVALNAWQSKWGSKWVGQLDGASLDHGLLALYLDESHPFDYFRAQIKPDVAAWVHGVWCGRADDSTAAGLTAWPWLPGLTFQGETLTDAGVTPLARITNLRDLSLGSDGLTGTVFDTLARLKHLRALSLIAGNGWLRDDLHRLADLPALEDLHLYLPWPGVKRFAPISQATGLRRLDLTSLKDLPDEAIDQLPGLDQLRTLRLCQCSALTGSAFASLVSLPELRSLDVSQCPLIKNDNLAPLASIPTLESLDVEYCTRLTDKVFTTAGKLPNLRMLNVSENTRITGKGLASLGGLTHLEHLKLSGCQKVTDASLTPLRHLTSLRILRLRNCPLLTVKGLTALAGLTNLRWLDLRRCSQLTTADRKTLKRTWPGCSITF